MLSVLSLAASMLLHGCALTVPLLDRVNASERPPILFENGIGRGPVRTWEGRKYTKIIRQAFDYSCGAAVMLTLLRHAFGVEDLPTEGEFVQEMLANLYGSPGERPESVGFSLLDLKRTAKRHGLNAIGLRLPLEDMLKLRASAIVHLRLWNELDHFAIWQGAENGRVKLADPSRGNLNMPMWQFGKEWTGHVLLVASPDSGPPQRTLEQIAAGTRDRPEYLVTWLNWQLDFGSRSQLAE